jgi:hypothetical protein
MREREVRIQREGRGAIEFREIKFARFTGEGVGEVVGEGAGNSGFVGIPAVAGLPAVAGDPVVVVSLLLLKVIKDLAF